MKGFVFATRPALRAGTVAAVAGGLCASGSNAAPVQVSITNSSFESATGALSNPALFPPSSGTVGGWSLDRSGLGGLTGATAPRIGVESNADATDGARAAYIRFIAGVVSEATISRTLGDALVADATYSLTLDMGVGGVSSLLADSGFRVYAGATLLASTESDPTVDVALNPNWTRRTLTFTTDSAPAAGFLRVEMFASSVLSVANGVSFDNLDLWYDDGQAAPVYIPLPQGLAFAGVGLLAARRRRVSRGRSGGGRAGAA